MLTQRPLLFASFCVLALSITLPIEAQPQPGGAAIQAAELARMRTYINTRNDPRIVLKVIHVAEGEDIDCLDETRQLGYDKPVKLAVLPKELLQNLKTTNLPPDARPATQAYGVTTELCPAHTVPRAHVSLEQVKAFGTLDMFDKKFSGTSRAWAPTVAGNCCHEYAHASKSVTDVRGVQTVMSINKPSDEHSEEFSLSQLWVTGEPGFANQETVEAGWQVARWRHPGVADPDNRRPYFFIYHSWNQYNNGCYDTGCGFITQTGTTHAPGTAFTSWSTVGGTQVYSTLEVIRDSSGNWWIVVDNDWVGYYPASNFHTPGLPAGASLIDLGAAHARSMVDVT